jgi:hypothetical protein
MLYFKADDIKRRSEIWVTNEIKNTYKNLPEYRQAVDFSVKNGYTMTVFIGGEQPLIPAINSLLDAQSMQ